MLIDARRAVRITSTAFDSEISGLIDACKMDLKLAGIAEEKIIETDPLIIRAILTYVKAHFGFNTESEKFLRSYDTQKLSLSLAGDYNT